jgi:hypothetical protein
MNQSFETLISANTTVYRSAELLHTVVVCDHLEMAGIPAVLRHVSIEVLPGSLTKLADDSRSWCRPMWLTRRWICCSPNPSAAKSCSTGAKPR